MGNDLIFSISTDLVMDGRELKAIKPDKNGVYLGIPLTAIGIASRNGIWYEEQSVIDAITSKTSRFNINTHEGNIEGEWGHPLMLGKEEDLPRLIWIDRTRMSHYFTRIYAKKSSDNKYIIVYGNVVPDGPYGSYLKASFEDPKRNTCFSFRSASRVVSKTDEFVQKRMIAMVTFDAVDGPGFQIAGKRYQDPEISKSLESVDIQFSNDEIFNQRKALAACESLISSAELQDIFRCNSLKIRNQVVGVYNKHHKCIQTENGETASVFETLFRN